MENIKKNIEAIRKELGVKQTVLAELIGKSQSGYSQIFTKSNDIKYSQILAIANKLGISVVDIITYPEKYVPEGTSCKSCKEKDDIIKHLNNYIKLLEEQLGK